MKFKMKEIDNLIQKELFNKYGDNLERRDYYKMEKEVDYLVGKGDKFGISFLVNVDYSHYINISLYKSGLVKMVFRRDENKLINLVVKNIDEVEVFMKSFLQLVDENQILKSRFNSLSSGLIPNDLIRNIKISNILD